MATRAKRQTIIDIKHTHGSKSGLIARTCFKLAEVALSDVKDSAESKDSFKIVCKNEVYVFSARSKTEKQKLLRAIVRATNDHFRQLKQRALLKTTKKVGEALDAGDTKSLHSVIKSESKRGTVPPTLGSDFWDGLDVCIAHHQYKDAVDFIADAQAAWKDYCEAAANKTEEAPYAVELQKRIDALATLLEHRILEANTKSTMKIFIGQLIRLGLASRAQLAFLSARHRQMNRRVRQLELDGNTVHFVDALSQAVFGMVAHSCLWYAEFFPARVGTSQLVAWVSGELELFGKAYRRQVHCLPPLPQNIVDVCYSTASNHARQLHSVGLNLNFMLDRLISPI